MAEGVGEAVAQGDGLLQQGHRRVGLARRFEAETPDPAIPARPAVAARAHGVSNHSATRRRPVVEAAEPAGTSAAAPAGSPRSRAKPPRRNRRPGRRDRPAWSGSSWTRRFANAARARTGRGPRPAGRGAVASPRRVRTRAAVGVVGDLGALVGQGLIDPSPTELRTLAFASFEPARLRQQDAANRTWVYARPLRK